jgi:hypothetical protein
MATAATIIVLFNLKPGVNAADYERFAREIDLPTVNRLPSIERFEVLRASGLMGGGASPYQYVEILRVKDMNQLGTEVANATMQSVVEQFRAFADQPQFLVTAPL